MVKTTDYLLKKAQSNPALPSAPCGLGQGPYLLCASVCSSGKWECELLLSCFRAIIDIKMISTQKEVGAAPGIRKCRINPL